MQTSFDKTRGGIFENLKPSKAEWKAVYISLLITLLSKGVSLWPIAYAIDDYSFMLYSNMETSSAFFLSQGRFTLALLSKILHFIGADAPLTNTLYGFIGICSQVFMGLLACRLWKISDNIALSCITILLISIHPYQAEIFTFKLAPFYLAANLFLAMTALYYSRFKIGTMLWTSIFLMLALGINQLVLHYVVIILAFSIVLEMLRQFTLPPRSANLRLAADNVKLWPRVATVVSGIVFYLIFNKIILYLFNIIPSIRTSLLPFNAKDIIARISQVAYTYFYIFFSTEPVMPFFVKVILLFIFLLSFLCAAARIIASNSSVKDKIVNCVIGFLLILTALLTCVGLLVVTKDFWAVPRVLSGVSIFCAGIVAAGYLCSGRKIHLLLLPLIVVVLFAFAGINNHIFTDQLRVNMRDMYKANRIISVMEAKPDFSKVKRVAVIGGYWGYASPILTVQGDMNISALSVSWSQVYLLNEVSGYNFTGATDKERGEAAEYCKQAHKWPDLDSVSVKDEIGIVCL